MTQQDQQWTVQKLLDWTRDYFTKSEVDSPRLCSEILLSQSLKCKRMDLYLRYGYLPTPEELAEFRSLVKRAAAGEPIAYLTGTKGFYSLDFTVSPAVLIPRPETEIIVEQAINHIREVTGQAEKIRSAGQDDQTAKPVDLDEIESQMQAQPEFAEGETPQQPIAHQPAPTFKRPVQDLNLSEVLVWDICTGSGCVAISIAKNAPSAKVLATDICQDALAVTRKNVADHKLENRVTVDQANLLTLPPSWQHAPQFDVITANPPYVGTNDPLGATVDREPAKALFAGDDGLDLIRPLVAAAPNFLKPGGILCMEFGMGQADEIRDLVVATNQFAEPTIIRDHQDIERTIVAVRK